jgi:putative endonuclease
MKYYTYILECNDGTLYTGWTVDIDKRVFAHNESKTGAKYTSARRPVKIVYQEECEGKSQAMKREVEIKKMTRVGKLRLINGNNHLIDL